MVKIKRIFILLIVLVMTVMFVEAAGIHEAAKKGDLAKVKTLLAKEPELLNLKDNTGRTPLHWACRGVHLEVVKYLAEKGANVNALDNNKIAPLHSLTARGHSQAAEVLIKKGAKVNVKDYENQTPLHYAAIYGHGDAAVLLVANGADIEAENSRKRTPLILAARQSGSVEVSRVLLDKGAEINKRDKYGDNPLDLAAWRGYRPLVNFLLSRGALVEVKGQPGRFLLSYAIENGLEQLFAKLAEKGADLQVNSRHGGPLLHAAAMGGSVKILGKLIAKGQDINRKDRFGWTPLHYATDIGHKAAVELLLQKGAEINARNIMGQTPFNTAAAGGRKEVSKLLAERGADQGPMKFPLLKGDYLGQGKPGTKPQLFANGIVSERLSIHGTTAFSPDKKEVCWSPSFPIPGSGYTRSKLVYMRIENNHWTAPRILPFSDKYGGDVPFFSVDGKKLYFMSRRPMSGSGKAEKERIWFVEKKGKEWTDPKPLDPVVNSLDLHWQFSLDKKGNLYFGSSAGGGLGQNDIYCSNYKNGKYTKPRNLGAAVNSAAPDFSPFISPGGDYLIFSRISRDSSLFISFRQKDGTWTRAQNMAEKIKSLGPGLCPLVSPDGKFLFYSGRQGGAAGVYWVDAKIIEEFRPKELK